MKANTHNFYHLLNAVKKTNNIKQYLWYSANNTVYFVNKLLRILNY